MYSIKPNLTTREEAEAHYTKQSYANWNPYCGKCSTMLRMDRRDYGWQCSSCMNKIDFNLMHKREAGLNSVDVINDAVKEAMNEVHGDPSELQYLVDTKVNVFRVLEELKAYGWISNYFNLEIAIEDGMPRIKYDVSVIPEYKGNDNV